MKLEIGKSDYTPPTTEVERLQALFVEMAEHLDYCGYGDSWERECARDAQLPERVDEMLAKIERGES